MDLNLHMERGIHSILSTVTAFYLGNTKGRRFLASFVPQILAASKRRVSCERQGLHVPPFLIASIAATCNLHCAGCYARADGMCAEQQQVAEMPLDNWKSIFDQAAELGVSFILLAGGEPLLKRDVVGMAASFSQIAFPIFTNGLLIDDDYLALFDAKRNLLPVLSIEGSEQQTDARRGAGVAGHIEWVMSRLQERQILFAVSLTVTKENLHTVATEEFVLQLRAKGCGIIFYIEYVPIDDATKNLALSADETQWLLGQMQQLKGLKKDLTILCFPGDEQQMGGCLAAGRGFFHISPSGAAEPCPFSPFSQQNLQTDSLKAVLNSGFFSKVRAISSAESSHHGGCTLFAHRDEIGRLR